tara:strand:- start:730 stop:984 length:255 start_codon:yes stop_codon:yes gene_type:complete
MQPAGATCAWARVTNMSESKENKNLYDFTLYKLQRLQSQAYSPDEAWVIQQCIKMYMEGIVDIEWKSGEPYVIMEDYNGQAMRL